jgi:hypothetical protein
MDISGIISISGMGGLFKVTGQLKNGLLAKSLTDGKNIPVYASNKVSALEDISVFCESDDIPLKDVFQKIKDKENGVFVDIGAHDGETDSNSLFFENLGWKGFCIEPNPEMFNKLQNILIITIIFL